MDTENHKDEGRWEANRTYLWVEELVDLPEDLTPWWTFLGGRNVGQKAFVCPHCKMAFGPKAAGMPGAFRTHISEFQETGGCFFRPKVKDGKGGATGLKKMGDGR